MPIVAKLDELGKPAWIVLTILGFMVWWPVGLATLAFIIGSGRMSCWKSDGLTRWHGAADQMRPAGTWWQPSRSSGNRAFDEYREETLRRLEEEQREFQDFLVRLRMAKDKAEFDQFMAERRARTDASSYTPNSASPLHPVRRRVIWPAKVQRVAGRRRRAEAFNCWTLAGVWTHHEEEKWRFIEPGDVEAAMQTPSRSTAAADPRLCRARRFHHGS